MTKMEISSLMHTAYYKNESIVNPREETVAKNSVPKVNNLKSIYVDSEVISDLNLKAAHTSEILSQKVKDIQENRPLKDVNFEKESKDFDKSNIQSLSGSMKSSQASYVSSKKVAQLLN